MYRIRTIKFIGSEIGNITAFKGFDNSCELLAAVRDGGFLYYDEKTDGDMYCSVIVGDYLFDYETGTMWKVVEG